MISEELYMENILDHYKNPHNKKVLDGCTCKKKIFNPVCGDQIVLFLKINNGMIEDVSFMGVGCAISQASASMITDKLKGISVETAKGLSKEDIFNLLGVPISPARQKCALLPLSAVHGCLEDQNE